MTIFTSDDLRSIGEQIKAAANAKFAESEAAEGDYEKLRLLGQSVGLQQASVIVLKYGVEHQ